nr:RNA-directed DNA polymerase, eukaryota, reverse transcriptase zinc-binding domain protein [Tanacetum cinerariifolium]
EQNDDLEREVSNEEIKRRFGIVVLIKHPVPNANMVKDFRPISLIESLYKVIAKVLCNIDTIIRVLDVLYRASGLRINMNKSNLMGISVDSNKVKHAAAKIGCLVLKTPFNYLGSRAGDLMSRIQSWHDVTEGMHTRLFALNRALMFKWVWRFFSQKNSLWVRVVKVLHGEDGKIGKKVQPRRNPRGRVEQAQFERLKELVEGVTLSNSNDKWSWSLVGSGDFSVSSVMKLIDNAILP